MAINNIIFDFDGTLMDTAPVILATNFAIGLVWAVIVVCRGSLFLRRKTTNTQKTFNQ